MSQKIPGGVGRRMGFQAAGEERQEGQGEVPVEQQVRRGGQVPHVRRRRGLKIPCDTLPPTPPPPHRKTRTETRNDNKNSEEFWKVIAGHLPPLLRGWHHLGSPQQGYSYAGCGGMVKLTPLCRDNFFAKTVVSLANKFSGRA